MAALTTAAGSSHQPYASHGLFGKGARSGPFLWGEPPEAPWEAQPGFGGVKTSAVLTWWLDVEAAKCWAWSSPSFPGSAELKGISAFCFAFLSLEPWHQEKEVAVYGT